jgi:hypothetical protein
MGWTTIKVELCLKIKKGEKMSDWRVREIIKRYCECYEAIHKTPYIWKTDKDAGSIKRAISYFDKLAPSTDGKKAMDELLRAAIKYLSSSNQFQRVRGWPFCDFGNNPSFWAERPKSEAQQEWDKLMVYIKKVGRYGTEPLPLSTKGLTALRELGGFNKLCDAKQETQEWWKNKFVYLYNVSNYSAREQSPISKENNHETHNNTVDCPQRCRENVDD